MTTSTKVGSCRTWQPWMPSRPRKTIGMRHRGRATVLVRPRCRTPERGRVAEHPGRAAVLALPGSLTPHSPRSWMISSGTAALRSSRLTASLGESLVVGPCLNRRCLPGLGRDRGRTAGVHRLEVDRGKGRRRRIGGRRRERGGRAGRVPSSGVWLRYAEGRSSTLRSDPRTRGAPRRCSNVRTLGFVGHLESGGGVLACDPVRPHELLLARRALTG
jgi:hypothetical protein